MKSILILGVILSGASFSASADTKVAPSTYVLEVSSNLECAQLEIELVSNEQDAPTELVFGNGAFSAAELSPGDYSFGEITCVDGHRGTETFDLLSQAAAPFSLKPGQAYFGGRLVIQEALDETASAPNVLDNCIRGTSRFRKEQDNNCRDGIGVDGERAVSKSVSLYSPKLEKTEIDRVRSALNATAEQLIYMPIETSRS
ncbi:MAG: hypothetical protein AAFQ12_08490 [Pseudomonadota bacterium]